MKMESGSKLTLKLVAVLVSHLILSTPVSAEEDGPSGPTFPGIAWNCSRWHTVAKGDTCPSIENKYNITSSEFLEWNPAISKDCSKNFWPKYSYCVRVGPPGSTMDGIAANCNKWHTVGDGDSCQSIEKEYKISPEQFFEWNPAVSKDCKKNFKEEYSYCIGIHEKGTSSSSSGTASSTESSTGISSSRATTTSPYSTRHPVTSYNLTAPYTATAIPPEHTPKGQPGNCNRWHWVAPGETCENIVNFYANRLTKKQLLEYNPTFGDDCGGLYAGWYICVGVQPKSSASIRWSTSQGGNVSIPAPTTFVPPAATYVQNFTASPQQSGIPESCQNFYQAEKGDTCNHVLKIYNYINRDQFFEWNPALKRNCHGLLPGYFYCVANFGSTSTPMPPTVTKSPKPIATGTIEDCKAWYLAVGNDDCDSIASSFGTFSKSDFISWNPSVLRDCSKFQKGIYYCVSVPGTPTMRTEPAPARPGGGSLPTQSCVAGNCTKFWLVSRSDTCESITSAARISPADFHSWNPSVGKDCKGLKTDYYVCVSTKPVNVPGSTVTITGGRPTTNIPMQTRTGLMAKVSW